MITEEKLKEILQKLYNAYPEAFDFNANLNLTLSTICKEHNINVQEITRV
jgi:hypothetical protein